MNGKKSKRLATAGCTFALIAPGIASAQSSVTLQGVIDAGVTYVNNQHGGAATLFDNRGQARV
jgi:predicted porin